MPSSGNPNASCLWAEFSRGVSSVCAVRIVCGTTSLQLLTGEWGHHVQTVIAGGTHVVLLKVTDYFLQLVDALTAFTRLQRLEVAQGP